MPTRNAAEELEKAVIFRRNMQFILMVVGWSIVCIETLILAFCLDL